MNRELFNELPDFEGKKEFIDKVMNENGNDIEKAKKDLDTAKADLVKAQDTVKELQSQIKTLNDSIKELKDNDNSEEIASLKKQIAEFEEADKARKEAEEKRQIELGLLARFDAVVGDDKFINEFTKAGAFEEFKKAISDAQGKGDKEVYAELVKDKKDWFQGKTSFVDITGANKIKVDLSVVEKFKKMTLIEQMTYAQEHPEEYAEISKAL